MSSITIHALDADLDVRLTEEARLNKKSKNQLIKDLLSHSLGMPVAGTYVDDYREFCGSWTVAEREAFDGFQADNSRIDTGDWQP
jgi:hypothetical protein